MPSALSCTASVTIRSMASSRALYIAWLRTVSSTDCFHPAYCRPMWYIDVPIHQAEGHESALPHQDKLVDTQIGREALALSRLRQAAGATLGTHCPAGASVTVTPPTTGELGRTIPPALWVRPDLKTSSGSRQEPPSWPPTTSAAVTSSPAADGPDRWRGQARCAPSAAAAQASAALSSTRATNTASESGANQTGAVAAGDPACRRNQWHRDGRCSPRSRGGSDSWLSSIEPPQRRDITRLEGPDGGVGAERLGAMWRPRASARVRAPTPSPISWQVGTPRAAQADSAAWRHRRYSRPPTSWLSPLAATISATAGHGQGTRRRAPAGAVQC